MITAGIQAITAVLLVLYVGWGIYTLDRRYRRHEESTMAVEGATILALILFYAFEISVLRHTMRDDELIYVFTLLGLFVSGAALYGHLAISFTTRILVEAVTPGDDLAMDKPRFGPAEALERQRDYDGAIQEYLVLARIFPRDPAIPLRIGENMLKLKRTGEAEDWFQRALRGTNSADFALLVTNRLAEMLSNQAEHRERAESVLRAFVERFPGTPEAQAVSERIAGLDHRGPERSGGLQALDDLATGEYVEAQHLEERPRRRRRTIKLSALGEATLEASPMDTDATAEQLTDAPELPGLDTMDEPLPENLPEEPVRGSGVSIGLSPMDESPLDERAL